MLIYYTEAQHPDLFKTDQDAANPEDHLPHPEKLALVLSEAPTLLSTSSQLRALLDIPFPPTSSFTHLISQEPRFAAIMARQNEQGREIAELRTRSARVVGRWYEGGVVGVGRCWVDWEGRVRGCERGVRRVELAREGD